MQQPTLIHLCPLCDFQTKSLNLLGTITVENCAVLGHYAASVVISYRCFGTAYRYHPQGSTIVELLVFVI